MADLLYYFDNAVRPLPNDYGALAQHLAAIAEKHRLFIDAPDMSLELQPLYDVAGLEPPPDAILSSSRIEQPARQAIRDNIPFILMSNQIQRFTAMDRALLQQRTAAIVVPSVFHADELHSHGIPAELLHVIPPGHDNAIQPESKPVALSTPFFQVPTFSNRLEVPKIYWGHDLDQFNAVSIIEPLVTFLRAYLDDFILFFDFRVQLPVNFQTVLAKLQDQGLRHHIYVFQKSRISAEDFNHFLNGMDIMLSLRENAVNYPYEVHHAEAIGRPIIVHDIPLYRAASDNAYFVPRRPYSVWATDIGRKIIEVWEANVQLEPRSRSIRTQTEALINIIDAAMTCYPTRPGFLDDPLGEALHSSVPPN